ncbi:MAG: hypothetical protein IIZ78_17145, partial [Clostridiales bacterium]|nr:hypothetical protein [Clostridiales bacterium]
PQAMISTTAVLIAVAKFESTPSIPTLARIDVNAAKMDERIAKTSHIYISPKSISIIFIYNSIINAQPMPWSYSKALVLV